MNSEDEIQGSEQGSDILVGRPFERNLEKLLPYLPDFFEYVNGLMPASLHTQKQFALSFTSISKLLENPLRFFEYVVNTKFLGASTTTKAMLVGQIADDYILGRIVNGDAAKYVGIKGDHKRNTKAGKAAYEAEIAQILNENEPDITVVEKATYETAERVIFSLVGTYRYNKREYAVNPQAMKILVERAKGAKQRFVFDCPEFGLPITGEIDVWGQFEDGSYYIADLKSMADVSSNAFDWAIRDRLLALQAFTYRTAMREAFGITVSQCYIVAGCADNHSNIKLLTSRDILMGEELYRSALSKFSACLMNGGHSFIKSY